jgi:hypothetical protein
VANCRSFVPIMVLISLSHVLASIFSPLLPSSWYLRPTQYHCLFGDGHTVSSVPRFFVTCTQESAQEALVGCRQYL